MTKETEATASPISPNSSPNPTPTPKPKPKPNPKPKPTDTSTPPAPPPSTEQPQPQPQAPPQAQGKPGVASLVSSKPPPDRPLKKITRRRAAAARKASPADAAVQGVFRQGSRRQPLDPYVTLPIIADNGKLKATSLVAAVKLQEGTLTHHVLQDSAASTSKVTKKINIPAPPSQTAQTFEKVVKDTFKLPSAFIRKRIEGEEKVNQETEYEVTLDDMEWLKRYESGKVTEHIVDDFNTEGLERMLDLMEKATARNFPISQDKATELFATHLGLYQMKADSNKKIKRVTTSTNVAQLNKLVEAVYTYWIQKRSKLKKPLLRRFWPITATNDSSPHLVFRPREKERYKLRKKRGNDRDSFEKMVQLYRDFSVVHMLMELLKRRERLNQKKALLQEDAFEQELWELVHGAGSSRGKRDVASKGLKIKIQGTLNVDGSEVENLLVPSDPQDTRGAFKLFDDKARKKRKRRQMRDGDGVVLDALWNSYALKENKGATDAKGNQAASVPARTSAPTRVESAEERKKKEKEERKLYQDFLLPLTSKRLYTEVDKESFIYPIIPTFPSTMAHHHRRHSDSNANANSNSLPQAQSRSNSSRSGSPRSSGMAQFKPRVRFRFRGRVGRGGRFMIDRIPISCLGPAHVIKAPQDVYANPHPLASDQDFLDPSKPYPRRTKATTFTAAQRNKLEGIFVQEDSEDEELERVDMNSLTPASVLSSSPKGKEDSKVKANGPIIRQRVPKMRFELY